MTAKSISIKGADSKSGGCAGKAHELTSGDLMRVLRGVAQRLEPAGLGEPRGKPNAQQKSAEGKVGVGSRSTRLRHSPERGETVGLAGPGTTRTKARTVPYSEERVNGKGK